MSDAAGLAELIAGAINDPAAIEPLPPTKSGRSSRKATPAIAPMVTGAEGIAGLLGVSESTVWRMSSAGKLPPPIKVSRGCTRWRCSDLQELIDYAAKTGRWPRWSEFENAAR